MSFTLARRGGSLRARGVGTLLASALLALALPGSAFAHTGASTVSCTGASLHFEQFASGANTVHYRITVDGTTADQGAFTLNAEGGRTGDLQVPVSLDGTHTVEAFAWWGPDQVADGDTRPDDSPALASQAVYCAKTPVPPPTTPPTTPTPPAASTPPATAASSSPAAPAPAPARQVEATQSRSATARVAVQRTCASRRARVTVSARLMRHVTFFVNGRRVRSVAVRPGQRSLTVSVPLRRSGSARQTITARVSFTNGANARTVAAHARRCAQAAVQPQFTG